MFGHSKRKSRLGIDPTAEALMQKLSDAFVDREKLKKRLLRAIKLARIGMAAMTTHCIVPDPSNLAYLDSLELALRRLEDGNPQPAIKALRLLP